MSRLRRLPGDVLLTLVAALAVVLALVAVVGVRVATADEARVPPGVAIDGVPVGGLDEEEAVRAVRARAEPAHSTLTLALPGEDGFPREVPVSRLAPEPRAVAAVREAMRPRSIGARIMREIGLGEDREVPLRYRPDGPSVRALVSEVAGEVDEDPRPAAVRVRGSRIQAVPSRDGSRVRRDALIRRLGAMPRRAEVPVEVVEPPVDDAAARRARAHAARVASGPVTVRGGGRSATIDRATLLDALRFPAVDGRIVVRIDPGTVADAVAPAFSDLLREPRSAGFRVQGEGVSVTPSVTGRRLDAESLASLIARRPAADTVPVRLDPVAPDRTTEQAEDMGIQELVGEFTTQYQCCPPRVTNIKLAARRLDGQIIPAGATFSLNDGIGERTREKGYLPAPQINAGELEDAVGGGVSQIATTFFNAAFFAGLRIVSHTPHEFYISRYPLGREATISWGGPELIVENDWPAAVLITAEATDTSVTFRLYSSDLGRRVTTETRGQPSPGTFTVSYTRRVFRGDELRRDEEWSWTYRPAPS